MPHFELELCIRSAGALMTTEAILETAGKTMFDHCHKHVKHNGLADVLYIARNSLMSVLLPTHMLPLPAV